MRLLFAAGDVGGARAILPVARAAHASGHHVLALAHGVLHAEGDADWHWLTQTEAEAASADVMVYATSVADWAAMDVAAAARARGIPLVHVLDNWSSYGHRLCKADGSPLIPAIYAVMDDLARSEALTEGVPAGIIEITGHPDLARLDAEAKGMATCSARQPGDVRVLFVSEPARSDSGAAQDPGSRGYDEDGVTAAFVEALTSTAPLGCSVQVAPHPREDRSVVADRWARLAGTYPGAWTWDMVPADGVRVSLHRASHVAGMSSILLYEAWLLGKPTASLQPGLRGSALRTLAHREGLLFCDTSADLPGTVAKLLRRAPGTCTRALDGHLKAAERVLALALQLRTGKKLSG
ncbi:MAG: hypothetical protein AB8B85_01155 [Paracoccaceae bacterium]